MNTHLFEPNPLTFPPQLGKASLLQAVAQFLVAIALITTLLSLTTQAATHPYAGSHAPEETFPEPIANPFVLKKFAAHKGNVLSLPIQIRYPVVADIDRENGDIFVYGRGSAFPDKYPISDWIFRVKDKEWNDAAVIPIPLALALEPQTGPFNMRCVTLRGKKCLVILRANKLWIVEQETFKLFQPPNFVNPIDLQKPALADHLCFIKDPERSGFIEPNPDTNDPVVTITSWEMHYKFGGGIRINLEDGQLVEAIASNDPKYVGARSYYNPNGVRDPLSSIEITTTGWRVNGNEVKKNLSPIAFLEKRPFILSENDGFLNFIRRDDISNFRDRHLTVIMPSSFYRLSPLRYLSTLEDPPRDRFFFACNAPEHFEKEIGGSLWKLHLSEDFLPNEPLLITKANFPSVLQPGIEYRVPIEVIGQTATIEATELPQGANIKNNVFTWTPTLNELGPQKLKFDLLIENQRTSKEFLLTVKIPTVDLSFTPTALSIAENSNYVLAYNSSEFAVVDTEQQSVVFRNSLTGIRHAAVNSQSVFLLHQFGHIIEYSFSNPSIPITHAIPSSQHAKSIFLFGEHFLCLSAELENNVDSLKRIIEVRECPDLSETALDMVLSNNKNGTARYLLGSKSWTLDDYLIDGTTHTINQFDDLEKIGLFALNTPRYNTRAYEPHLLRLTTFTDPSLADHPANNQNIPLPNNITLSLSTSLLQNHSNYTVDATVTHFETRRNFPALMTCTGRSLCPRIVANRHSLAICSDRHLAAFPLALLADHRAEQKNQSVLQCEAPGPISLMTLSEELRLQFSLSGGKPPYRMRLDNPLGELAGSLSVLPDSERDHVFVLNPQTAEVFINGPLLKQVMAAPREPWLARFLLTQKSTQSHDVSHIDLVRMYQKTAKDKLALFDKAKISGIPLALPINLVISDSNNSKVIVSHNVVIDVSMDEIRSFLKNNAYTTPSTN